MNPAEGTNWVPGLMMLGAGAIAALAFLLGSKRLKSEAPAAGSVEDLTTRYEAKLRELKDHLAEKHLIEPSTWAGRKSELEQQAAAILRERDGVRHEGRKAEGRQETKAAAQQKDTSVWAKNPTLTGGLLGGAVVGFFMLLGFNLSNSASERDQGMSMTGGQPAGAGQMQPTRPEQPDAKVTALAQRVEASPQDPDAIAELGLLLLRRQAFDDVKPLADRLALIDPFHVKGRVVRAVMRAVEGDAPGAMNDLERLATLYPEAWDARMFAGFIAMEDDPVRAAMNLEAYSSMAPQAEQPPMIRMMIQQLRAKASQR